MGGGYAGVGHEVSVSRGVLPDPWLARTGSAPSMPPAHQMVNDDVYMTPGVCLNRYSFLKTALEASSTARMRARRAAAEVGA